MITDRKDSSETQYSCTKQDGIISKQAVTLIVLTVIYSNPTKPNIFIFKHGQKGK